MSGLRIAWKICFWTRRPKTEQVQNISQTIVVYIAWYELVWNLLLISTNFSVGFLRARAGGDGYGFGPHSWTSSLYLMLNKIWQRLIHNMICLVYSLGSHFSSHSLTTLRDCAKSFADVRSVINTSYNILPQQTLTHGTSVRSVINTSHIYCQSEH